MKKFFKRLTEGIKNNKECLAVCLIASTIAPVVMSGIILAMGYCHG